MAGIGPSSERRFYQDSTSRETLLYRGGVVSSFFITVRSLSYSYRIPSREVLASLRGRRDGRHMMGSEGEAEQSENRPAEAEPRFLRTRLVHRPRVAGRDDNARLPQLCRPPLSSRDHQLRSLAVF